MKVIATRLAEDGLIGYQALLRPLGLAPLPPLPLFFAPPIVVPLLARFSPLSPRKFVTRIKFQCPVQRRNAVVIASQLDQRFASVVPEPHVAVILANGPLVAVQGFFPPT